MQTTTAQLNKEQPIRKLGLKLKPSQCLVRGLITILKKKKSKTLEGNKKKLTTIVGAPVPDNQNVMTAGPRGPMLLQEVRYLEKLAYFDLVVIPERRMHAKGSGAIGAFTVTHDITRYTKAKLSRKSASRRRC
jgi:catalase